MASREEILSRFERKDFRNLSRMIVHYNNTHTDQIPIDVYSVEYQMMINRHQYEKNHAKVQDWWKQFDEETRKSKMREYNQRFQQKRKMQKLQDTQQQQQVEDFARQHKFTLVNGPPGCGKTYIFKHLSCDEYVKISPTNLLCNQAQSHTIYNLTSSPIHKLTCKNVKFDKHVAVDEVFLLSCEEMQVILQCMSGNDKHLLLFGDSFQKKQIGTQYWYDAFQNINDIQVVNLTQLYRAKDLKLQSLIMQYRGFKTYPHPIRDFPMVSLDDAIRTIECCQYTIICGTHQRQQALQRKIDKRCVNVFNAVDGYKYRINQQVFTVNEKGVIIGRDIITSYVEGNIITQTSIHKPIYDVRYEYDIVRGDVVVIDLIQGQELQGVIIDCETLFQFGSFYVALSRVQSWDKVYILTQPKEAFQCDYNNVFQEQVL